MADKVEEKTAKSVNESFSEIFAALKKFGHKIEPHIGYIYGVILLIAIGVTVLMVGQSLGSTATNQPVQPVNNDYSISFDNATLEKVKDLNSTTTESITATPTIPDGRINPFAE